MIVNLQEHKKIHVLDGTRKPIQLVEKVVYRTYTNGRYTVQNVPYVVKTEGKNGQQKEEFLSFEVMEQLTILFRFMEARQIYELDYQHLQAFKDFIVQERQPNKGERDWLPSSVSAVSMDKKDLVEHVKRDWLEPAYQWYLKSKPRLNGAEGCPVAKDKLEFLKNKVEDLTELHREIIQLRYLAFEQGEQGVTDIYVYTELHLSRAYYYKQKREALYALGLMVVDI